jgi:hypothetical protein
MKSQELFAGFDPEEQAKREQYLADRYGGAMQESLAQSRARVKNWTRSDWAKAGAGFDAICRDLVRALNRARPADSAEVQAIIRRHYEWLRQFWTPTRESYAGHGDFIVDSDLRQAYDAYDARLAEFASAALKVFAKRELA